MFVTVVAVSCGTVAVSSVGALVGVERGGVEHGGVERGGGSLGQ